MKRQISACRQRRHRAPTESAPLARRAKMAAACGARGGCTGGSRSRCRPGAQSAAGDGSIGRHGRCRRRLPGSGQPAAGTGLASDGLSRHGAAAVMERAGSQCPAPRDPSAPMGPGMGGGLGGGAQPTPDVAERGSDGLPRRRCRGRPRHGPGMTPARCVSGAECPEVGQPPATVPQRLTLTCERKRCRTQPPVRTSARPMSNVIDQLISQLDQDQMLLVKVHVPQGGTFGVLGRAAKVQPRRCFGDRRVQSKPCRRAQPCRRSCCNRMRWQAQRSRRSRRHVELREQLGRDRSECSCRQRVGRPDSPDVSPTLPHNPASRLSPLRRNLMPSALRWMMQSPSSRAA